MTIISSNLWGIFKQMWNWSQVKKSDWSPKYFYSVSKIFNFKICMKTFLVKKKLLFMSNFLLCFLAHLCAKCSWWALVIASCLSSVVFFVVVNNFFKQHLLIIHWVHCSQTSQECSLGDRLSKLIKEINSMQNSGLQKNLRKSSCLKPNGLMLRYLVCSNV